MFSHSPQAVLVHTVETTCFRYFIDLLMAHRRPVMLVGGAGCGKTVLINDKLQSLGEDMMVTMIPFNYYTTSLMLQQIMEKPLEKKAGRNYGPPGTKRQCTSSWSRYEHAFSGPYGTVQPVGNEKTGELLLVQNYKWELKFCQNETTISNFNTFTVVNKISLW